VKLWLWIEVLVNVGLAVSLIMWGRSMQRWMRTTMKRQDLADARLHELEQLYAVIPLAMQIIAKKALADAAASKTPGDSTH